MTASTMHVLYERAACPQRLRLPLLCATKAWHAWKDWKDWKSWQDWQNWKHEEAENSDDTQARVRACECCSDISALAGVHWRLKFAGLLGAAECATMALKGSLCKTCYWQELEVEPREQEGDQAHSRT